MFNDSCAACEGTLVQRPGGRRRLYRSRACSERAQRARARAAAVATFAACPVDGTPIQRSGHRGRPAVYCSAECRAAARRGRRAVVAEAEAITRGAAELIPAELRERARWVRWDLFRGRKLPLQASSNRAASSTDPHTWTDYAAARTSTVGRGLGFVLGAGIGCIDLDHCITERGLSPLAERVLAENPSAWVERSQSGTGLHVWGLLPEAPGRRRKDIEVYSRARYIALGETYRPGGLAPLVVPA